MKTVDLKKSEARSMDCMDCHNRPSHEYHSPSKYVNDLMAAKNGISSIPWFKSAAMEALKISYGTSDSASTEIKNKIINFYKETYPDFYKQYNKQIIKAISDVKAAYAKNAFPEMKVDYSVYPRHIGHLESNGCFRCHNDRFKSSEGKVISKDCNLCHTIVAQGKAGDMKYTGINSTLEFVHPVDIGDAWKESNCMDCHSQSYQ